MAEAGTFAEVYKADLMEILGLGEEDYDLISEGAAEDIGSARKRLQRMGWAKKAEPGKALQERELSEMTNLVSSDDPLKDHMAKAMAVLQGSAGWNHQDRKKYMRELIELT